MYTKKLENGIYAIVKHRKGLEGGGWKKGWLIVDLF